MLREKERTWSEEMRTHEGRRRVEDSAVLAHRFDDEDAITAAAYAGYGVELPQFGDAIL
jgi:hypothetical protein